MFFSVVHGLPPSFSPIFSLRRVFPHKNRDVIIVCGQEEHKHHNLSAEFDYSCLTCIYSTVDYNGDSLNQGSTYIMYVLWCTFATF